jgi:small subunit ribosomal protein S29e
MPNKLFRSHPRGYGKDSRKCRVCKAKQGLIRKYEMMVCRRCFREIAKYVGFKKVTLNYEFF